jgi:integrase
MVTQASVPCVRVCGIDDFATEKQLMSGWTYFVLLLTVLPDFCSQAARPLPSRPGEFHAKKFRNSQAAAYEQFLRLIREARRFDQHEYSMVRVSSSSAAWAKDLSEFADRLIARGFAGAGITDQEIIAASQKSAAAVFHSSARGLRLDAIRPTTVAAYIEQLGAGMAKPSVKQHLAAVPQLFDYLVTGGILPSNPAGAVRGPKYVVKRGKTPVLSADQARQLLDSIDVTELSGLRDRALIGVMVYSFARVSAAATLRVEDYFEHGKRAWLRLHEKGGKRHEVPCHHNLATYLDAWINAAGIAAEKKGPLFRAIRKGNKLTENPMAREDVLAMIKRRAKAAALPYSTCCHTFRATGITTYMQNGGTLEHAQQIAAHESPRTTKLYDRTQDEISLDEVERIRI